MGTNIRRWHRVALDLVQEGNIPEVGKIALVSCMIDGQPTAAVCLVHEKGDEIGVFPMFVAVTPDMKLTGPDGTTVIPGNTHENMEEWASQFSLPHEVPKTLGELCAIDWLANMEDVDVVVDSRGDAEGKGVGRALKPEDVADKTGRRYIGIKVLRTDLLVPDYLRYALEYIRGRHAWSGKRAITPYMVAKVQLAGQPQ